MTRKPIDSLRFENMSLEIIGSPAAGTRSKKIFEDVNFELPTNEIVWFRGQSGGGKSVLVKIMNGLLALTSGRYIVNGEDVSQMDFEDFKPYRLNIGYSFDYGGLINNRTIEANLALPLDYHAAGEYAQNLKQVEYYLNFFGLNDVKYDRPSSVVGGLRKAACVARAFVTEPEMLLLDDPTTGLRIGMIEKMRDLILAKRKEGRLKHVFVATEDERLFRGVSPIIIEVRDLKLFRVEANYEGAA
jgi:phospholipid/cholesterol/gamma-HCH transport system ATP-binding protein